MRKFWIILGVLLILIIVASCSFPAVGNDARRFPPTYLDSRVTALLFETQHFSVRVPMFGNAAQTQHLTKCSKGTSEIWFVGGT